MLGFGSALWGATVHERWQARISHEEAELVRGVVLRPWRRTDEGQSLNLVDELEQRFVTTLRQDGELAAQGPIDWRPLRELIIDYLPYCLQHLASLAASYHLEPLDAVVS